MTSTAKTLQIDGMNCDKNAAQHVRVYALDYLRGLLAVSVMIFHYSSWAFGEMDASSLLGRLGIYAVSTFYVLSGLSLAIVYRDRISSFGDVTKFYVKRIFRIFPLYWIVASIFLLRETAESHSQSREFGTSAIDILLNFSLTFGFIKPWAYLTTGAWSIGNEMVFYSLLPFLLIAAKANRIFVPLAILLSVAIAAFYAFVLLDPAMPLASQWRHYVNPLNQSYLFFAGVGIGFYGVGIPRISSRTAIPLGIATVLAFAFWPAQGDRIELVTGWNRVFFSAIAIFTSALLFNARPVLAGPMHRILESMGNCCYSIYLLHPIAAFPAGVVIVAMGFDKAYSYIPGACLTLVVSWLSFRYVERPMMQLGRSLTQLASK